MNGFLDKDEVQIVAVCDVDSWRLAKAVAAVDGHYGKQAPGTYKGCRAYRDFREVLERDDVDAVSDEMTPTMPTLCMSRSPGDLGGERPATLSTASRRSPFVIAKSSPWTPFLEDGGIL